VTERAKLRATIRIGCCPATCLACAIIVAASGRADAQTVVDPADAARVHLGPLALSPTLSLLNAGRDSNVFNDPQQPRDDLTATLAPSVDAWLRIGRAQLSGRSRLEAILFQQYSDQSTVGTVNTGRVDVALNRLRPYATASFLHLKDRPDAVIDARVQRIEHAVSVGTAVTLAPKTAVSVYVERSAVSFAETGSAVAPILRRELNRTVQLRGGAVQYQLTPLTTARLDVQQELVRFKYATGRDAQGLRITPSFEFKPRALVSGQVRVGMLNYEPADPRVPRFTGPIAAVSVRSIVAGDNEITAGINRDLFYSAEAQVYYVQTLVNGGVTRQLNQRWNATASLSRLWLAFSSGSVPGSPTQTFPAAAGGASDPDGIAALVSSRPDTVLAVGVGLGYRLTRDSRAGLTVAFARRDAQLASSRYDNLRVFGSVTYGAR
jgi:hypothetical protein